jgi:hypothetical protein
MHAARLIPSGFRGIFAITEATDPEEVEGEMRQ